ncbi:10366_t:CDS:2 [Diversispora eburnea]|uniref:10366_t:CDS:1 n=1 Tax=Diversispora eburnea TaxID=1213867 RepID=A0A9N8W4Q4_9GLOM|nr:10366_t:CDS:2 [Diversispora eburnea]
MSQTLRNESNELSKMSIKELEQRLEKNKKFLENEPTRINIISMEESIQLQQRQKGIEEELRLKSLTDQFSKISVENNSEEWKKNEFSDNDSSFTEDSDDELSEIHVFEPQSITKI